MNEQCKIEVSELKNILTHLNKVVVTIDKIGSGFEDKETTALALLLFFREEAILDKLAAARKTLNHSLLEKLGTDRYDKWIENEIVYWKPPYEKDKNEIAKLLDSLN
ncbi:hypothetical protein P0D91_33370 [Pseudomonas sp. CBSPBW29]|jgi:hypothetical protein|uniref:hypothetical protein n=1 Tax=Pseudomonas TaxID=286 RepID=UPI0021AC4EA4|nr:MULTISPECIES: hypothetical protein [unclassified Pseudomonas]WEL42807.1 hypothetical protein P0D91_33370 [Pseudomonas sp. CBSPBW29]WEL63880.1 hypothetical protein P0D93_27560 [Pseudomonas sp. CBSPGW29]WEL73069.1 hypothetical protein P0D94_13475 [Pseudomonas sp. CBSPCGW29]WEL74381.1 hypothetical protein P0D92_19520 [Pseudomonas sp. CBSPAW29]WEL81389.1 hypothetical protein P0D95_26310 [Pseudomonas sp. CBSPCAW29]